MVPPGDPQRPGVPAPDLQVAARTILELTATLMDEAFQALGEGVVLGTMPAYLASFGAQNARYLDKRFGPFATGKGAVAALGPLNLVSRVTHTRYDLVEATANGATKRLHACEFAPAFENKSPFARAMICQLHRAVYQGSVNALLPKGDAGYEVSLTSRILFGDAQCDFEVASRAPRPDEPQRDVDPARAAGAATAPEDAHAFYTAMMVAFVDYLSTVLPKEQVDAIVQRCSGKVGAKVHSLFFKPLRVAGPKEGADLAQAVLTAGGRAITRLAAPLPVVQVTACPLAKPIVATTKARGDEAPAVRGQVCGLCKGLLQGTLDAARPGLRVERDTALTLGHADCRYRVVGP